MTDHGTIDARFLVNAATDARCSISVNVTQGTTSLLRLTGSKNVVKGADSGRDCLRDATDGLVERMMQQLPPGLTLSQWP